MKRFTIKAAAFVSAAVISVCSSAAYFASAADTEEKHEVTIVFNITEDMTPTKATDMSLFETITTTESNITIPAGYFSKGSLTFSGWTIDGVIGYTAGSFYSIPKDVDKIVFEPCFLDPTTPHYNVTYNLEYEGEELEKPDYLVDEEYSANAIFTPNYAMMQFDTVGTRGLTDGERVFDIGDKLVMPDHDLVLYPVYFKRINVTYYAGDVDRINGNSTVTFKRNEGSTDQLASSDRFSRSGFVLSGWKSSVDGSVNPPEETVDFPHEDVVYTAVWTPKEYKVVFIPGNGGTAIKVPGLTDEEIVCPEPGITVEGKYFAGWKDSEGKLHAAGEKYKILGAKPGLGVSLTAVWEDGEAPTVKAILGDADGDGKVDSSDASAVLAEYASLATTKESTFADPQQSKNADVNHDEKIDSTDASDILAYYSFCSTGGSGTMENWIENYKNK